MSILGKSIMNELKDIEDMNQHMNSICQYACYFCQGPMDNAEHEFLGHCGMCEVSKKDLIEMQFNRLTPMEVIVL